MQTNVRIFLKKRQNGLAKKEKGDRISATFAGGEDKVQKNAVCRILSKKKLERKIGKKYGWKERR